MKKSIVVFCVILAVLGMVGCKQATEETPPANAFVGAWKSDTWVMNNPESPYNGKSVYLAYTFNNDNSFTCEGYADNVKSADGFGTYSIPSTYTGLPSGVADSLDITYGTNSNMEEERVFYFLNGNLYGGIGSNAKQYTKQ